MAETSKVVTMKPKRKKARLKDRPTPETPEAKALGAAPSPHLEALDALIEAKVEAHLSEIEHRLEQSLHRMETKLERALAPDQSMRAGDRGLSLTSLLSVLEAMNPLSEAQPLVGELAHLLTRQLEKLGFIRILGQTVADLMDHVSMDVDEFGYDQAFEDKLRPLLEFLFYTWWRVEMNGLENVPDRGRALLVSNHSGTLPFDGAMIKFGIRELHPQHRITRVLMHDMFNSLPILGPILSKTGCVRACHENGQKLLEREHVTLVFPEGAKGTGKYFKNRYKLERFGRGGFVRLAARTSSPIIPVAVVGAEEIYPIMDNATLIAKLLNLPYFPITPTFPWLGVLGLIPLPSKWTIDIGEPIRFDHLSEKDLDDDFLIDHLGNEVRLVIQNMIDNRLKKRKSIWFG